MKQKQRIWRLAFYIVGLMIMSLGVALCTKVNLGIAPGICVGYAISNAFGFRFPVTVFIINVCLVGIQFLIRGKNCQMRDLFQIPFTIGFSLFLSWFGTLLAFPITSFAQKMGLIAISLVLIGVGVSMSVKMNIAPNPPDGIVHTISVVANKDMGLIKNICDMVNVSLATTIDLLFTGRVTSVGLGTVLCMIFLGRVISVYDRFFKDKMLTLAGMNEKKSTDPVMEG